MTTPNTLPPIQNPLVDTLMDRADTTHGRDIRGTGKRRVLPDITTNTAKLTLGLSALCLYVLLMTYVAG